MQARGSIQLSLWLHADCDVTSDPEDSDGDSSSQSSTERRANGFQELPLRAEFGPMNACARMVSLRLPDTGRGNFFQVSEARVKTPSRRDAVPQRRIANKDSEMREASARGCKRKGTLDRDGAQCKKIGTLERDTRKKSGTPREGSPLLPETDQDGFYSAGNLPFQFFPFGFLRTPSSAVNEKQVSLQQSFEIKGGIIPCFSAPLKFNLENKTSKRLQVPKHTVIAEVYPLLPVYVGDDECENSEAARIPTAENKTASVQAAGVQHEQLPFEDAEIKLESNAPPILSDDKLPVDLQDLVKRTVTLNEEERQKLTQVLKKNHDVFVKDNSSFGKCPWVKYRIHTPPDHPPIKQQARPLPLHYRKAVYETLMKYLECGALIPSQSPWASPLICVPKKSGEVRVAIDYRLLNAITEVPAIPIPRTKDLLQRMGGHKIYHAFDLANGYLNLEIHEEDQPKTAIIVPEELGLPARQFQFTRLSFGLSSAPGIFQYVTDRLVIPAKEKTVDNDLGPNVSCYLDDICIAGSENESMMQRLQAFFNRIRASGLLLKAKKCALFQNSVPFLGHIICETGIKTQPDKIDKIIHWPRPESVKELRTWLGLVNYYFSYVPNMAAVAAPLYKLLRKNQAYKWDQDCEEAFSKLKTILTTPPVLGVPKLNAGKFILTTDASVSELGGILSQLQDGKEVTISFWSKTLKESQRNLCITNLELLAVVEGIEAFHHFLAGAPFILRTDHSALQWLKSFKCLKGKLARWLQTLAAYKFVVEHVRGVDNPADALSRRPNRPCSPDCKTCCRMELKEETLCQSVHKVMWTKIMPTGGLTPDQIRRDQRLDPDIMPIISGLIFNIRPSRQEIVGNGSVTRSLWHQFNSLILQDGILYRRFEHASGNPDLAILQLILPEKHVQSTVEYYHGSPNAGQHYGRDKTLALLKRYFYWPGIYEDVYNIVAQCPTCFSIKGPHQKSRPPLKLFRDGLLHGRWHVDLCGPFVKSSSGYRYILVAVESFSCWPVVVPLKTQTALEITEKLIEQVFSVYGCPLSIHSDKGKSFENELLRNVMSLYGINKTATTAFHPRAQGKVEVFIRTLKQHLAMLVQQDQKDWDKHLPLICQVYRALPVSSTSYSPYEILFGAPMRIPLDLARGQPPTVPNYLQAKKIYKDYPLALRQHLWQLHKEVRENIHLAAQKMKVTYDKTSNYTPFSCHQLVWLYTPQRIKGLSPKLQKQWTGPWEIISILNDCVARIRLVADPNKMQIVNVDRLAMYFGIDNLEGNNG